MKTPLSLLFSTLVGFMLAVTSSCGAKQPCDATSCATGCCDADGQCRPGDTVAACGTGARACSACQATATCDLGSCRTTAVSTGGGSATGGGSSTGGGAATGGGTGTSAVVINELATSDGDFVELFNTSATVSVDLGGYLVADLDTASSGPKLSEALTLPAGTQLAPGGFLLVLSGTPTGPSTNCGPGVASCFFAGFGLSSSNGDSVFLLDPSNAVVARIDYPAGGHAAGHSYGRLPDGTGAFVETARTPGLANASMTLDAGVDAGVEAADGGVDAGVGAGRFVVVRVGPAADGGVLSNASTAVTLEHRAMATGAVLASTELPRAHAGAQRAFALSGSATSEGVLAVAGDVLTLAGYAVEPGVASVRSSRSISRVVARAFSDGGIDTSTLVNDAYAADNVRSAATVDGTGYWLGGTAASDAGVRYVVHGSTGASADVVSAISNVRAVKVVGGQLYASTQQGDAGTRVFAVGTGTPTTTTLMVTSLVNPSTVAPHDFALLDLDPAVSGLDTLYVADTEPTIGVRKYVLGASGAWAETAQFHVPASTSCYGVAVAPLAGSRVVLCTTGGAVYRWEDTGSLQADGGGPEGLLLTSAPAGTAFRGLVIVQ